MPAASRKTANLALWNSFKQIRGETLSGKAREPDKMKVIILNDDITTFDFVVRMLVEIFFYEQMDASG